MTAMKNFFHELIKEIFSVTWTLYKIMVPIILVIKVIEEFGGVALLSHWLSPLMSFVGLPEEMGLVWATTLLTNIYAGLLVFMNTDVQLTVAQASILGTLMLIAHSLPIEAAIAKKAGVSITMTLLLRIGGGILFSWFLHQTYEYWDLLGNSATVVWSPAPITDQTYLQWAWLQVENLVAIFLVISALLFTLKVMKLMGIERAMAIVLRPVLRLLGISREATNMTIVGITLGLSFGGGLLINEAKRGHIPARDVFTAIMLLNLVHSMIEDTILILLIGADFFSIFWGRLLFGLITVALLSRALMYVSETTCEKFFYRRVER